MIVCQHLFNPRVCKRYFAVQAMTSCLLDASSLPCFVHVVVSRVSSSLCIGITECPLGRGERLHFVPI